MSWGVVDERELLTKAKGAAQAEEEFDELELLESELEIEPPPARPDLDALSNAELLERLKDPRWRLRNLYYIKDKRGRVVLFQPNEVQDKFLDELWYRNVVPKARQRGFTTVVQIWILDSVLFEPNTAAAVIAQDQPTVIRIFREKIKFAYDRLPAFVRQMVKVVTNNKTELIFENGSSVYVAVSTRGGTLQILHVSELGQISKKAPDKAHEIQTGSLPSVDQTGIIIIESTIESAAGLFPDLCRRAVKNAQLGRRLSRLQYRLHFASWWDAREYEADPAGVIFTPQDIAYFERMEAAIGRPLSKRKRAWYVQKRDEDFSGDWEKMKSQYPTILDEGFEVSQEGIWLSQQLAQMRLQGRICPLPWDPAEPVHFFWDIGRGDDNAVWCGQYIGPWTNWLKFYESASEPYAYLINQIRAENPRWTWGKTWLPHDGVQRQAGAHQLRDHFDIFEELGVPHLDKVDKTASLVDVGIPALRDAMSVYRMDSEGCADGLLHLEGFSKVWNDKMGLWSSIIEKNGHQHAADALRQHAQIRHLLGRGVRTKKPSARKRPGAMGA